MIRIGIVGYGNLARGVECALRQNPDMTLAAVFTRRDPASVQIRTPDVPVLPMAESAGWKDRIDVMLLCGGSATDLPEMTPGFARDFHVVDSYDNHSQISQHFGAVDAAAKEGGHIAMISAGWDPGLFSIARLYAGAILPKGQDYTFWGPGISQGHSDAVRRIPGVADCRQYTLPVEEAVEAVRGGESPLLCPRQKHRRHCFVVAEPGADLSAIESAIVSMPGYFADYDTQVTFLSQQELDRDHKGLPHGGYVIRNGVTGWEEDTRQTISYSLSLQSNPQFTASVLVACARAAMRLHHRGLSGCYTMFDIAPADLSIQDRDALIQNML